MDIKNIESIYIDVEMNGDVKLEILRTDNTLQVDKFKLCDVDKRDALNEFLKYHKLDSITTVRFFGKII